MEQETRTERNARVSSVVGNMARQVRDDPEASWDPVLHELEAMSTQELVLVASTAVRLLGGYMANTGLRHFKEAVAHASR